MGSRRSDFGDGASPGKIFIGGLAKDTTLDTFVRYFGKYGEIIDSVIMKDRHTGRPRGFGFITYADPSVVDTVIAETHVINGKQVEIKRTIPKGSAESKDFKTKKIFVGGIPTSVTEDELKNFFSKYGKVVEHEIIRDHASRRSRGFGFIVFDSEQVVDNILVNGNMIDMTGTQVEIKKAEPKKPSNPAPAPAYGSDSRGRAYGDGFGGFGSSYSSFGSGGFGPAPYRSLGGRLGDYGGYGGGGGGGSSGSEFGGRYGDFGGSDFAGYRGESSSLGYSSRFGSYAGGFGGGYGGSGLGAYGRGGGGYGSYGGSGSGGVYDSGPGADYGGGAGGLYGSRAGYSGASRYHPYTR
uniref:RRM domain-containing protein n=1 Tax=Davidia involucrata TaxID=16924 RepID=A0A5B6YNQ3_DAVIN